MRDRVSPVTSTDLGDVRSSGVRRLRELYLLRHGETEGESSIRYHGSNDVPLSDLGRAQMRAARRHWPSSGFDAVIASPLTRASEGARIAAPDARVSVERGFREIDFGRWEGLTRDEIRARDPELYEAWRVERGRFDFPDGEARATFDARVAEGLDRLLAIDAERVLVVVHMGVVRFIVRQLCGGELPDDVPALGQVVHVWATADAERSAASPWRATPRPVEPHGSG